MEIGVYPVGEWLASWDGRALINYGATVSHPGARTKLLTGIDVGHSLTLPPASDIAEIWSGEHMYAPISDDQIAETGDLIARGLDEGGLGIGFGITYTPGASRSEILRLFEFAAARGVPAYVHLRGANSGGTLGAFQEVIANAAATGASVHIVHMNSSADEMARTTLEMIRGAQERGLDVTTEAYPYTAGSTRIESALFDSWVDLDDTAYGRLQRAGTTERLTRRSFREYRAQGGWVVIHGRNEETSEWIIAQPDVIVASDGIPYLYVAAHPRGAGTFARVLGYYVRERGALTLMDALAKMTIMPARRLEGAAPSVRRKGRVQVGTDADLTVFDPATIIDRSTYAQPDAPSEGVLHVMVGGTFVVRDGRVVEGVFPGRAVAGGG
jgi:dihydroorotase